MSWLFPDRRLVAPQQECVWRDISYQLKISHKRKTIGFQVKVGNIFITVPYGTSRSLLEQALISKHAWFKEKCLQSQQWVEMQENQIKSSIEDCSLWPIWGITKPISWYIHNTYWYCLSTSALHVSIKPKHNHPKGRMDCLRHWYHEQALYFIHQRISYWCTVMGIHPGRITQITVRKYSARWGSCSIDGHLKFNRLLAMVPAEVFDYVIVHELCHLQHMHHQPVFWQLVNSYCPTYAFHQRWLKKHGSALLMSQLLSLP